MSERTRAILPNLRPMVAWDRGQNYQVNGYLQFQMECLGESPDYDYWFFDGVGGDAFTQVFTSDTSRQCHSVSQIAFSPEFARTLYDAVGYGFTCVTEEQFNADRPRYVGELVKCIDRGIPVVAKETATSSRALPLKAQEFSLLVGYEDGGGQLLFVEGDRTAPYSVPTHEHVSYLFVIPGARRPAPPLAEVYRTALLRVPELLTRPQQGDLHFGREAFVAWARHLLTEDYAGWTDEQMDLWRLHTTYVCMVATNGSELHFLSRGVKLCPDLPFLPDVLREYAEMGRLWAQEMDATGGSFNVTRETLRNQEAKRPIAAFIQRYIDCCDRILAIYRANGYGPGAAPRAKPVPAMAAEAYGAVRPVREIGARQPELEILYLPACRVIGVEQTYGPERGGHRAAAPQWSRAVRSEAWQRMSALPRAIPRSCVGWTCDYRAEARTFQYLAAVLTPAGTAVPEGCQFRDVPPTLVAAGRWDEPMDRVMEEVKRLGYIARWGDKGCGWNAELYLDEEEGLPTPNGQEWRWLIPIKEADFRLSDRHPCHVKLPAFEVLGFSKIVASGGEQYGQVRDDGRWERLRRLGGDDPTIYGVASHDAQAPQGQYRYTVGVNATDIVADVYGRPNALLARMDNPSELFCVRIPASDWLIFRLSFRDLFGQLWLDDPYRLVRHAGWEFSTRVNLHSDVFGPLYVKDGEDDFEFWMPVQRP